MINLGEYPSAKPQLLAVVVLPFFAVYYDVIHFPATLVRHIRIFVFPVPQLSHTSKTRYISNTSKNQFLTMINYTHQWVLISSLRWDIHKSNNNHYSLSYDI